MNEYPKDFLELLESITAKRPKTVIQHILKYGYITSQELKDTYGYNHPPRAVRDVREYGIPLVTYRVIGSDGRRVAAYKFGNPSDVKSDLVKSRGRTVLSKALKQALIDKYGARCFIYLENMDESILQVDHRIPYEIGGEHDEQDIECFMLLSPSANRSKSWSCEHCVNWEKRDQIFCLRCFWAYPENYDHIAGKTEKTVFLIFSENEIADYNKIVSLSGEHTAQETIKNILHDYLIKLETKLNIDDPIND